MRVQVASASQFKPLRNKTRQYLDMNTGLVVSKRQRDNMIKGGTNEQRARENSIGVRRYDAKELKQLYKQQHKADYPHLLLTDKQVNERLKDITKRLRSRNQAVRRKAELQLAPKAVRDIFYAEKNKIR